MRRNMQGFVLWECLLTASLSVIFLLSMMTYWQHWSAMLKVIIERAQVVQRAVILPILLLSHWRLDNESACDSSTQMPRVLLKDSAWYHQRYFQSLTPQSSILLLRACDQSRARWYYAAYFLSNPKKYGESSLYEKKGDHDAVALVEGISGFHCIPGKGVSSTILALLSCDYQVKWPSFFRGRSSIHTFHRLIPVIRAS